METAVIISEKFLNKFVIIWDKMRNIWYNNCL